VTLRLKGGKITVNKDRLVEIDPENFEVEKFKRAIVKAWATRDGKKAKVTLIVDIRAGLLTVSTSSPDISAGMVGLGLMTEFMLHDGYDFTQRLSESPRAMNDVARFPLGGKAEALIAYLHSLRERGEVFLRGTGDY
jgi:hypothetical protein